MMMMMKMASVLRQKTNSEAFLIAETTLITSLASVSAPRVSSVKWGVCDQVWCAEWFRNKSAQTYANTHTHTTLTWRCVFDQHDDVCTPIPLPPFLTRSSSPLYSCENTPSISMQMIYFARQRTSFIFSSLGVMQSESEWPDYAEAHKTMLTNIFIRKRVSADVSRLNWVINSVNTMDTRQIIWKGYILFFCHCSKHSDQTQSQEGKVDERENRHVICPSCQVLMGLRRLPNESSK